MYQLESYLSGKWQSGDGVGSPIIDAVTGEHFSNSSTKGLDIEHALQYGRTKGGEKLRKMNFHERGRMLKKLALHLLTKKKAFYELSYRTGATKIDSWIDIEGGIGNLFANASLRKELPLLPYHVEGKPIDLSRGGQFMAHHILVPKEGVAVHINAFNFPIWGMFEKCASNWMAGVPAVVKPATSSAFLTEYVVKEIISSGILPEGALQLISGSARDILNYVDSQDVVTFTGSATTGVLLKSHQNIVQKAVPFNMEADSLNSCILGEDAAPGTPEFDLFVKEVVREMTVKCGQKCTAIRRAIVPEKFLEDVGHALTKRLQKISIGNPRLKEVRMGALVSKDQVSEVINAISKLKKTASIIYESQANLDLIDADKKNGAFLSPVLLQENNPLQNLQVHDVEAFGPVCTLMPYKNLDEAVSLSKMGKGSLVSSVVSNDRSFASDYTVQSATHHGRILVLNRENAKESTGHGSPLPYLVHGGPGRAGGGEEMGGLKGIYHYMQRCAIQASPNMITKITDCYQANSEYNITEKHPFTYHWEDVKPGMSLKTHKRTLTDTDIINFANLTWDHFYAHTDITSLDGSIFEKRTAHGYFILSAAAGLFVYPNKGPVLANYGFEDCRFVRPLYHNDSIYVRLTCKEKSDRDSKGKEFPSGIVKWFVEVFDQDDELVAIATVLTLVKKKSPFTPFSLNKIINTLNNLSENSTTQWGIMTPQHMIEHLENGFRIASSEVQDFPISSTEEEVEKLQESLFNYHPFPKNHYHPRMKKGELMDLKHSNLDEAKKELFSAIEKYHLFFKENKDLKTKHAVFGCLSYFEWELCHTKHLTHHFEQFGILIE